MDPQLKYLISTQADLAGATAAEGALHRLEGAQNDLIAALKAGVGIDIGARIVDALASVPARFREAVEEGVKFNATLESSKLSLASLLANFEPGKFKTVSSALGVAGDAVKELKKAAAESPASFESLVGGLTSISGAAFAAGIPLAKQIPLTVTLANATKALGLADNQLAQEARALLTGNIEADAQLAKSLGITSEEIARNKERGKLYEFLTERLSKFAEAGKLAADTYEGRLSNLGDTLKDVKAEASEPIFEALKDAFKSLNEELGKEGVREALKAVGYEVAEIVKAGSGLLNFAVRNADSLLAMGKAAGFLGVALASLKIRDLVEALGAKALKLVGLGPPLAAATAQTNAYAAALGREAVESNAAAAAGARLATSRGAAGQSAAGASALGGTGRGGGRGGAGGAAGTAAIIGLEIAAVLIERETAALNAQADAAEEAGKAILDFADKRRQAVNTAKSFDDARNQGLALTVQRIADLTQEEAALEKKARDVQDVYNDQGDIIDKKVFVNLTKLTDAERERLQVIYAERGEREKEVGIIDKLTAKLRGAGAGQQQPLTAAERGSLEEPLKKDRERRVGDLNPAAQAREYTSQIETELERVRKQLLDAGADAVQVGFVKDLEALRAFADSNQNLKGQEIAVKAYDKIFALQEKIKKASEDQVKATKDVTEAVVKYAEAQEKAAKATEDAAAARRKADASGKPEDVLEASRAQAEAARATREATNLKSELPKKAADAPDAARKEIAEQEKKARTEDLALTAQRYDAEQKLNSVLAERGRIKEVGNDAKEELEIAGQREAVEKRIGEARENLKRISDELAAKQRTELDLAKQREAIEKAAAEDLKKQKDLAATDRRKAEGEAAEARKSGNTDAAAEADKRAADAAARERNPNLTKSEREQLARKDDITTTFEDGVEVVRGKSRLPGGQPKDSAPSGSDLDFGADGKLAKRADLFSGADSAAAALRNLLGPGGLAALPPALANSPVARPGDPNVGAPPIGVPTAAQAAAGILSPPGAGSDPATAVKGAADATKDTGEALKSAGTELKTAAEGMSTAATESLPPAAAAAQSASEALTTNLPPLKSALESASASLTKDLPALASAAEKIPTAIESGLGAAAKSLESVGSKVEKGTADLDGKVAELGNTVAAGFDNIVGSFTTAINALKAKVESLSNKFDSYAG